MSPTSRLRSLLTIKPSRRSLWSGRTFRSASPANLLNALEAALPPLDLKPASSSLTPPVILFSISKHLPSPSLAQLVERFQSLVPTYEPIGCLAEDPSSDFYSVSFAKWSGPPGVLVPFTSTIPSRAYVAVGREILPPSAAHDRPALFADHDEHGFQATGVFGLDQTASASRSLSFLQSLPEELKSIPPDSVRSLIFFSAPGPEPLLKTLELRFPSAMMMGCIGSSTAFETGRRSTLFRGKSIWGDQGAVGVAVVNLPETAPVGRPQVSYERMQALGKPMRITQAQGNIILTLDSKTAAQCLLQAINESPDLNRLGAQIAGSDQWGASQNYDKDKEFYLEFLDSDHQKTAEVCRITGGSPTRGAMAIEREREIQVDEWVQFVHFGTLETPGFQSSSQLNLSSPIPRFEFDCRRPISVPAEHVDRTPAATDGSVQVAEQVFSCGSEYGFIPAHRQIVNISLAKAVLPIA